MQSRLASPEFPAAVALVGGWNPLEKPEGKRVVPPTFYFQYGYSPPNSLIMRSSARLTLPSTA